MTSIALLLILAADGDYSKVDEIEGVTIETRSVPSSSFVELRFTTTTTKSPNSLCDEAFGTGDFDPDEPNLKSRRILFQSENERVTYDQITPPVVSNRDYAVRATRLREGAKCRMTFEAANDVAPKLVDGWVRVLKLKGSWVFEPIDDQHTKLTYIVFSDPGGAVPAFMAEGSRRKLGVTWVKRVIARAK